ncbi:thioredoxin [Coprobacter sp.]
MSVIHLNEIEFSKKVADLKTVSSQWKYIGDKPALIDFFATWCGPCKALSPILDELAEEYRDQIHIYKIDVDKEEKMSEIFGIRTVPTLLFAPIQGDPHMISGVFPKHELKKEIENYLLK